MKYLIKHFVMALVALAPLFAACQDHHYVPYDKVKEHPKIVKEGQKSPRVLAPMEPRQKAVMEQNSPYKKPPTSLTIVSGVVDVSKDAASAADPSWTLYVIARPAGGGPPLAAVKEAKPSFPFSFVMTEKNIMMGEPTPGMKIMVEARLDEDGDAITKGPKDLFGKATQPYVIGSDGVAVTLNLP